ncbi:Hypothetical predicted protein [Octopus vulgaris]|uniref:Uncharacterized protein n=1 Tax=Octopus vulgaris TaxID=6645 RepID=A0AA36FAM9_OCTVU|nr:Hypothetical predicted protein [Octopus vulgaris]
MKLSTGSCWHCKHGTLRDHSASKKFLKDKNDGLLQIAKVYRRNLWREYLICNPRKPHATENDINIRHKGNEESDEQYSPPRGLIERLPSDQSTQRPEDTRNSIVPVKDSQENDKTTVTEDLAFAEEHRESIAEMRQKILNTLEVLENTECNLFSHSTVTCQILNML